MGKKHRNLFEQVHHKDTLWRAYQRAAKGRRRSRGYLAFRENEAANIERLSAALADGSYTPGEPRRFYVYEPKRREISALPFADRVAQHALVSVIEPIFESVFLPQSYACRPGKGTHRGAMESQAIMRRMIKRGSTPWYLQVDFSRYFASIDRGILHREVQRKISCRRTLNLFTQFHAPHGTGMPIGNLTSQLSANIYGHIFDRWLAHTVKPAAFVRYMDDTVIFGHCRESLALLRHWVELFCANHLRLSLSRWKIAPASRGLDFLGYRIWPTHKLLRKASVTRAKRALKRLSGIDKENFLSAWRGHAQWADSHNLMRALEIAS